MKGNNKLILCHDVLKEAVQDYLDKIHKAREMVVLSVAEDRPSGYESGFVVKVGAPKDDAEGGG